MFRVFDGVDLRSPSPIPEPARSAAEHRQPAFFRLHLEAAFTPHFFLPGQRPSRGLIQRSPSPDLSFIIIDVGAQLARCLLAR